MVQSERLPSVQPKNWFHVGEMNRIVDFVYLTQETQSVLLWIGFGIFMKQ